MNTRVCCLVVANFARQGVGGDKNKWHTICPNHLQTFARKLLATATKIALGVLFIAAVPGNLANFCYANLFRLMFPFLPTLSKILLERAQ